MTVCDNVGVLGKVQQSVVGFKKSIESGMTRSSRIRLDIGLDESDIRYNLYLDSALNWLDSDDSIDIPS